VDHWVDKNAKLHCPIYMYTLGSLMVDISQLMKADQETFSTDMGYMHSTCRYSEAAPWMNAPPPKKTILKQTS